MWLFFPVSRSKKATTKPSLKVPAVATLIAPAGIFAAYPAVRPMDARIMDCFFYFTNFAFLRYCILFSAALNISSIIWSLLYLLPSALVFSRRL